MAPDDTVRSRLPARLVAWLVTGPLGFLVAGFVDLAALVAKVAWARARRRPVRW